MNTSIAPKGFKWVATEDGSQTLYSEQFDENCHSLSGAIKETRLHYLQGCQVLEKYNQKEFLTIFEVGFGTGIGLLETYYALKQIISDKPVYFISSELDEELIIYFKNNRPDGLFSHFSKTVQGHYECVEGKFHVTILIGDIRKKIQELDTKFRADCIYQDAFSPRKCPELWTVQWFTELGKFSAPDVILSTYSSSARARKSMLAAGWTIVEGEKFGPKKSSTRATKQGVTAPEILEKLARSPLPPFNDQELSFEKSKF